MLWWDIASHTTWHNIYTSNFRNSGNSCSYPNRTLYNRLGITVCWHSGQSTSSETSCVTCKQLNLVHLRRVNALIPRAQSRLHVNGYYLSYFLYNNTVEELHQKFSHLSATRLNNLLQIEGNEAVAPETVHQLKVWQIHSLLSTSLLCPARFCVFWCRKDEI